MKRLCCLAVLSIAGQFRGPTFVDGLAPAVTLRGPPFHPTGYAKPTSAKKQLSRGVFDRGEIKLTPGELSDAQDRFEESMFANNEPSAICTQIVCLSFLENDGKPFGGGGITYHTNNLKAKSEPPCRIFELPSAVCSIAYDLRRRASYPYSHRRPVAVAVDTVAAGEGT